MIKRVNSGARMSDMVVHQNTAYWVEVPEALPNSLKAQTEDLLKLADATLRDLGADKTQLISATIYLKDVSQVEVFNQVWDDWVVAGKTPIRACIQAQLVDPNMLVEIAFIAAV